MGTFKVVCEDYGMILHQKSDFANDSSLVKDLGAMYEHMFHPCVAHQDENLWVLDFFIYSEDPQCCICYTDLSMDCCSAWGWEGRSQPGREEQEEEEGYRCWACRAGSLWLMGEVCLKSLLAALLLAYRAQFLFHTVLFSTGLKFNWKLYVD